MITPEKTAQAKLTRVLRRLAQVEQQQLDLAQYRDELSAKLEVTTAALDELAKEKDLLRREQGEATTELQWHLAAHPEQRLDTVTSTWITAP